MAKAEVLIVAAREAERRALSEALVGAEFETFVPRVVAALPLPDHTAPLMLIGAGLCRPLAGGLAPGEVAASAAAASPLARAVLERLKAKGFRPGALLEEGAEDAESVGLALTGAELSPEAAWLNLRLAPEPSAPAEESLEALGLKLLVLLSTLDRTPPPTACSSCRNPCGIFK